MKGQGGGGTARGGGKTRSGGGAVKIQKSKQRQTKDIEEKVILLRQALFDARGKDKDVSNGIAPAFMKYDRNGVNLEIEFTAKLTEEQVDWAFEMARVNMESIYDASGYGWDDDDKLMELTEPGSRFLLVRKKRLNFDDRPGELVGFVHFRFTIQGEVMDQMIGETSLHVWDIHLQEAYQRKGVGRHLLTLLELIARRERIKMISVPVQLGDDRTAQWINKVGRYVPDESLVRLVGFDPDMEGFQVYSKVLAAPVKPKEVATVPTPSLVPSSSSSSSSLCSSPPTGKKPAAGDNQPTAPSPTEEKKESESVFFKMEGLQLSDKDAVVVDGSEPTTTATASTATACASAVTTTATVTVAEVEDAEGEEGEDKAEQAGLNMIAAKEADIVLQLAELFVEKHGRQPTEEEKDQWRESIRETLAEAEGEDEEEEGEEGAEGEEEENEEE